MRLKCGWNGVGRGGCSNTPKHPRPNQPQQSKAPTHPGRRAAPLRADWARTGRSAPAVRRAGRRSPVQQQRGRPSAVCSSAGGSQSLVCLWGCVGGLRVSGCVACVLPPSLQPSSQPAEQPSQPIPEANRHVNASEPPPTQDCHGSVYVCKGVGVWATGLTNLCT